MHVDNTPKCKDYLFFVLSHQIALHGAEAISNDTELCAQQSVLLLLLAKLISQRNDLLAVWGVNVCILREVFGCPACPRTRHVIGVRLK